MTPDGIYTPRHVLHGTTNAVTYLQGTLHFIFPESLRQNVLYWLDDIMCHAPTIPDLLKTIRQLFTILSQQNLKLHPGKCKLFAREIRWCGRLISADGIRFDPRRIDGLLEMAEPTDGGQLQQFFCALQWVKTGIPDFSSIVEPLHLFLEKVYYRSKTRKKRSLARVSLLGAVWGEKERKAFKACMDALARRVTLAHRDPSKRLYV